MTRRLILAVALLGGACHDDGAASTPPPIASEPSEVEPAPSPDPPPRDEPRAGGCTVTIDDPTATLRIDGEIVPDFRLQTLRELLGEPDRVEVVRSRQRYEEFGAGPDDPPTSMMIDVEDRHIVYDDRGLVFRTRGAGEPEVMLLFFEPERSFTNTAPPDVVPLRRGGCELEIRGVRLDPEADVVPSGVDYRTRGIVVHGRHFGATSIATEIDGLYSEDGRPYLRLYLDGPRTRRPSYAEILL